MAQEKISTEKWAVENRNKTTGETVRYIECLAENTAKILSDLANKAFKANNQDSESTYLKIHD